MKINVWTKKQSFKEGLQNLLHIKLQPTTLCGLNNQHLVYRPKDSPVGHRRMS